jgi:hypothetical protein
VLFTKIFTDSKAYFGESSMYGGLISKSAASVRLSKTNEEDHAVFRNQEGLESVGLKFP